MSSAQRKQRLMELIAEYNKFKKQGKLDLTSEETIRTWLNELLEIFDWDVRDTSQILQEKVLSKAEKERLKEIGSQNTRPDYTFRIAKEKLTFLDAKDISVDTPLTPESKRRGSIPLPLVEPSPIIKTPSGQSLQIKQSMVSPVTTVSIDFFSDVVNSL